MARLSEPQGEPEPLGERTLGGGAPPPSAPVPAAAEAPTPVGTQRQLLAGRYEIRALVGAGGMGTVYRAYDAELDEMVALKVLRAELTEVPGVLDRFRREAKLARRVTHANVARVFDIGEDEGLKFLSMELVEGESLSAALAREGAFPLGRAVAVGAAVAEGLASAHAAGVVHRDLKPDNVLLARDGRVVVTDFGIAHAIVDAVAMGSSPPSPGPMGTSPPDPAASSSAVGVFLGTPAYMAPEQVEARPDADERADVYAFGLLLYELFTGHRAWPGTAPYAVAMARVVERPPDPRARRPDLPDAYAELVLHCLARAPGDRPASIREAGAALALAGGAGGGARGAAEPAPATALSREARGADRTVAVLPFGNAGGAGDDYLAEELTDDLIDALSMTRGLRVRPRGAVGRFRGADGDPQTIGRELGVEVVVLGTVRRAEGRVRVTGRLIGVADGFQIWARRFDRPAQEVLAINDEVARAVAEALTVAVRSPARAAPNDPRATDLYLRARHEYRKFWPDHLRASIALFEQALAVAPEDPLVLSGLALARARFAFFAGEAEYALARGIAERAVAAAPQIGEAQLAYGSMLLQHGEVPAAVRALGAAVALSPGLAEAHAALGRVLAEAGAVDEGIRRLEAAIALDPDTPMALPELGRTSALLGQWERAEQIFEGVRRAGGLSTWTSARLAMWRRRGELVERYLAELPEAERKLQVSRMLRESLREGRLSAEASDMEAMIADAGGARRQCFLLQMRAEISAYLGDGEQVFTSLRRALDVGLFDRLWLERCPLLDDARADPRFAAVHAEVARRTDAILAAYPG